MSELKASNTTYLMSVFLCIKSILNYKEGFQKMARNLQINGWVVTNIILGRGLCSRFTCVYSLLKPFADIIMRIQGINLP